MYSGIPIVNMVMSIACAMNLLLIVLFYYINFAADGKNFFLKSFILFLLKTLYPHRCPMLPSAKSRNVYRFRCTA